MAKRASFLFIGEIQALGRSTDPLVEADERTAVVKVLGVIRAPQPMRRIAGREITMRLLKAAEPGELAEFAAEGLTYGTSMAVREVGRRKHVTPEAATAAVVGEQSERDEVATLSADLKVRAADAPLVVLAHVTGVAQSQMRKPRDTEHDPEWVTATVLVDRVLKGRATKQLHVVFANSRDVMWYRAPKLVVGQHAVLLLRKGAHGAPDARSYTVLEPLDVQNLDRAPLIAELV